jgi:hypothetical protein
VPQSSVSVAMAGSPVTLGCDWLAHRFGNAADKRVPAAALSDGHDGRGVGAIRLYGTAPATRRRPLAKVLGLT